MADDDQRALPADRGPLAGARGALAALREEAEARLRGLEREFDGIVAAAEWANTDDEHDPEGATIAFERQHAAALIGQARARLAEIGAAARRLAEGGYGRCERCGGEIGAGRLAARPAAATCIRCAAQP